MVRPNAICSIDLRKKELILKARTSLYECDGRKGGFGFIGLIGAPTITLTADVIEILGVQPPQE